MTKQECIKHFGTGAAVAAALGIDRSAITLWGKFPPEGRQAQLEILTGGKLLSEKSKQRKAKPKTRKAS